MLILSEVSFFESLAALLNLVFIRVLFCHAAESWSSSGLDYLYLGTVHFFTKRGGGLVVLSIPLA